MQNLNERMIEKYGLDWGATFKFVIAQKDNQTYPTKRLLFCINIKTNVIRWYDCVKEMQNNKYIFNISNIKRNDEIDDEFLTAFKNIRCAEFVFGNIPNSNDVIVTYEDLCKYSNYKFERMPSRQQHMFDEKDLI